MHASGVAHPDIHLRNLLITDDAAEGLRVYLLDFDRAVYGLPVSEHRREHDLRRLARSARKLGTPLGSGDWRALRDGYGAAWPAGVRLRGSVSKPS
jgi:hypothetical protein